MKRQACCENGGSKIVVLVGPDNLQITLSVEVDSVEFSHEEILNQRRLTSWWGLSCIPFSFLAPLLSPVTDQQQDGRFLRAQRAGIHQDAAGGKAIALARLKAQANGWIIGKVREKACC